jgi:tRNA G26 N,N-dimethylase Trm1
MGIIPSGDRAWAHVWAWCAQVLSLSIDFYVRIFVRVYSSAEKVKESATKQMYVYQSSGCDSFYTQRVARKVRHNYHFFFCQQDTQMLTQI